MSTGSRLSAIVCADAVGFGARVARDEAEAHHALTATQALLRSVFESHGGRVVNTWGDGVIAEFGAISEAVRAAVEFQDQNGAEDHGLRYRIGINLGDVIHEDDDLFGHGVNVAARLQQAAEPGDILISDAVHAAVSGRLAIAFDRMMPVAGKAQEPMIPAWRVVRGDNAFTAPPNPKGAPADMATLPAPSPDQTTGPVAARVAADDEIAPANPVKRLAARARRAWRGLDDASQRGVMIIGGLVVVNGMTGPPPWALIPAAFFIVRIWLRQRARNKAAQS